MKKTFTILVSLFATILLQATVHTVSNIPSTLAQYNTIQAAINAASSGDTVYVHGSPNAYAAFTINGKRIAVIGPGWSPDKNLPFTAVVGGMTLTGGASANGIEIQGLVITSTVDINTNHPDNVRFIRNHLTQSQSFYISQGSTTYSGYLLEGNLFDNAQILATTSSSYQNFLIQNNYFYESGCCINGNIHGFVNSVNVLVNHNLFFGPASGTRDVFNSNCRFLTITNNVFVHRNAATQNSFSTFNNNITYYPSATPPSDPWAVNSNVNSGGNVSNQNPQMVSQTSVNNGINNPLNDFSISAGPANNSGSDGKDMGLLFDPTGSLNWTNSRNSRLPRIFAMNITNPTIPVGGTLNVQVEGRKSN